MGGGAGEADVRLRGCGNNSGEPRACEAARSRPATSKSALVQPKSVLVQPVGSLPSERKRTKGERETESGGATEAKGQRVSRCRDLHRMSLPRPTILAYAYAPEREVGATPSSASCEEAPSSSSTSSASCESWGHAARRVTTTESAEWVPAKATRLKVVAPEGKPRLWPSGEAGKWRRRMDEQDKQRKEQEEVKP